MAKSDQDSDSHWFGSLDTNQHWCKKLDPNQHWNHKALVPGKNISPTADNRHQTDKERNLEGEKETDSISCKLQQKHTGAVL